jgi:GT2 family glycosyltransferase
MKKVKSIYKKISIIVPTMNGWNDTKEWLKSIKHADYPKELLEVIVIDNNSSDGTPESIKKYFPQAKIIKNKYNLGYTKAINIGVKLATGEYLIFGNNDVVYDKNYFKEMVKLAESDKSIGIIGGIAYLKDNPHKLAFNGLSLNPFLGYHIHDLNNINKIRPCDILPAGGFFLRTSILKKVGLLDEGYFYYFEDVDIAIQAKRNGYKVLFNPNAIYYHGCQKTATMPENLQTSIYHGYRSKLRCIIKNGTLLQIITSITLQFFLIHWDYIQSPIGTYKHFIKAFYWNIKHLKETLNARKETITI